jgi:hypothetical protein
VIEAKWSSLSSVFDGLGRERFVVAVQETEGEINFMVIFLDKKGENSLKLAENVCVLSGDAYCLQHRHSKCKLSAYIQVVGQLFILSIGRNGAVATSTVTVVAVDF